MARILVIEDDESVRAVVCRALERVGHTTFEGVDGGDGFDTAIRNRIDLVITDLVMPNQEGIETIQRLKRLDPRIPIIAMSGVGREGEFSILDDALLIGADYALEKPFDVTTLLAAVDRMLGPRGGALRPDADLEGSA
jgi:DNA-binding response OmpR family regulator